MRRWSDESFNLTARGCSFSACLNLAYSFTRNLIQWSWNYLRLFLYPPLPLGNELARLRGDFSAREDLRASIAEARQRAKPLLIVYLAANPRYETSRNALIEKFEEARETLKNDYELFFCSSGAYTLSSHIISHIVGGNDSAAPNTICKFVCLLPFAFNASLMHRGRGHLSNLMEPLTGIPSDAQRNLVIEILNGSAGHVACPEHVSLNSTPRMLPHSTIISAFNFELTEDCVASEAVVLLSRLAEFAHALVAPVVVCQRSRIDAIQEARRLREEQAEEYQIALQQDRERARQREADKVLERQKTEEAERQREAVARMEEDRRAQALEMMKLARKLNTDTIRATFARICIRINGAKLLCYCHPETAIHSLENAIKNLDLLLDGADPKLEHPTLIVGPEENGIVPAMFINGDDGGWRYKRCGPFGDDYGLVGPFPTQQIARDRSLLQNGIESDCSILWGKLPPPVNH